MERLCLLADLSFSFVLKELSVVELNQVIALQTLLFENYAGVSSKSIMV